MSHYPLRPGIRVDLVWLRGDGGGHRGPVAGSQSGVAGRDLGGEPSDDGIDLVHAIAAGGDVESQGVHIVGVQLPHRNLGHRGRHPIPRIVDEPGVRPAIRCEKHDRRHDDDAEEAEEDHHGHHGAMAEASTPGTGPPSTGLTSTPTSRGGDIVLAGRRFPASARLVMAIINRTPDSFYDAGATFADDAALAAADAALEAGADILDIGGVKAGPGEEVDEAEEIRRTARFIEGLHARHPEAIISVDTWRAAVGRAACEAGASLVNDAWGGVEPELAEVSAEFGVGIVCTHAGGQRPRTRPHRVAYADVMTDVLDRTLALAERAAALGVPREGILIDPGHDFGKNTRHSLEVTRRLTEMVDTGWPVLVSLSRKDFVAETLDVPVPAERLTGTLAATAISAWLGARVYRVHDVEATRQVLDMVDSIAGVRQPAVSRRGLA
jgi:dihydropteroate synthase